MPLTATFRADFSSFQDAISKAQGSLSAFDGDAKKVERSLGTMMDRFSGRKAAEEAMVLTKAINEIGGATALTGKELQQVNIVLTETIKKYDALGKEAPEDMRKLATEVKAASKATQELEAQTRQNENAMSLGQKAAGLMSSAFGQFTLANLATTAIMKVTSEVMHFVELGTQLPAIEGGFNRLAVGIGQNAEQMLSSMQKASKGLVTDFELMQSANKAMLLGLPVTSESMGELTESAIKLGRAMGQDATKSVDDMITALGRSSPMILDNLGLTVKVGEANEAYAAKLGKTADQLTDAEKKMAFYEAAVEAARKKTAELGDQTLTLGEIATQVWNQVGNAVTTFSADVNVGLGSALSSWENFARFMITAKEQGLGVAIQMQSTAEAVKQLGNAVTNQFVGPATPALIKYGQHLDQLTEKMVPLTAEEERLAKAGLAHGESAAKVAEGLGVSEQAVKKLDDSQKEAARSTDQFNAAMVELNATGAGWQGTLDTIDGEVVEAIKYYLDAGVAQNQLATAYGLTAVQVKAVSEAMKESAESAKELAKWQKHLHDLQDDLAKTGAAEVKKALAERNQAVADGLKATQQLEADAADFTAKQTLSATDYKIFQIQRWVDKTIAAYPGMGQQLADYTEKVKAYAKQQTDALTQPADEATKAMDKLVKDATTSFAVIGKGAADMDAGRQASATGSGDVITDEYRRQQEAFMSFKGIVVAGTGEMAAAQNQLATVMTTTTDQITRDWAIRQAQMQRGEIFLTGMSSSRLPVITRQGGGPVASGGAYLVGEEGPELFRPTQDGMIYPTGSASRAELAGTSVVNNFYINGSIRDLARPLMDEITRSMKQGRQWPSA